MTTIWNPGNFAEALTNRSLPLPQGVISWTQVQPAKRFGVYRGNVSGALVEALAVRYSVTKRLVGDEFFHVMAREFALANLPRSPVLIGYGADFPAFVAEFEAARPVPYLTDVARLESAHWEAYHAADVPPVEPQDFSALNPAKLAGARFEMLPSFAVVTSAFPIVSIWRTNTADSDVTPVDLSQGEDALIVRPALSVDLRLLPKGAALFLSALKEGKTLGEAAEQAGSSTPVFDLASNLAGIITARIVARIIT